MASAQRLARWAADFLGRLRASHSGQLGLGGEFAAWDMPYLVSFGGAAPLPWTAVLSKAAGDWIGAALDAGGSDRLLIMSADETLVLGICRTDEKYQGFVFTPKTI